MPFQPPILADARNSYELSHETRVDLGCLRLARLAVGNEFRVEARYADALGIHRYTTDTEYLGTMQDLLLANRPADDAFWAQVADADEDVGEPARAAAEALAADLCTPSALPRALQWMPRHARAGRSSPPINTLPEYHHLSGAAVTLSALYCFWYPLMLVLSVMLRVGAGLGRACAHILQNFFARGFLQMLYLCFAGGCYLYQSAKSLEIYTSYRGAQADVFARWTALRAQLGRVLTHLDAGLAHLRTRRAFPHTAASLDGPSERLRAALAEADAAGQPRAGDPLLLSCTLGGHNHGTLLAFFARHLADPDAPFLDDVRTCTDFLFYLRYLGAARAHALAGTLVRVDFSADASAGDTPRFDAMLHPALALVAARGADAGTDAPVPNDLALASTVLTGGNASGKTTLMRAALLNVLLAQQLGLAAARAARLPVRFTHFHTYMNIADVDGDRDSLFQAEARRMLHFWTEIARPDADPHARHLALFDELFSGTNPDDAVAAGSALLQELHRLCGPRLCVLLSTHFWALADPLLQHAGFQALQLRAFHATPGVSRVRAARDVLAALQFPPAVLDRID